MQPPFATAVHNLLGIRKLVPVLLSHCAQGNGSYADKRPNGRESCTRHKRVRSPADASAHAGRCVGPIQLLSQPPATVESLEGDYLRLALCTYERLDRKDGRLRIAEPSDQDSMRIDFDPGSGQHWDLSFINEDPGRLTRVEVTSPRILEGSFSREHALAIARACAA